MNTLTLARIAAGGVSAGTFVFLFLGDSFRSNNAFLIPDLVLCGLLVAAALLPATAAAPTLLFGFGLSAGVLMTSAISRIIDGDSGIANLLATGVCIVMAGALLSRITAGGWQGSPQPRYSAARR